MNFNTIGKLILLIYDELNSDENSKEIINELDCADNDNTIKENFSKAVTRLREIGKDDIANYIEQQIINVNEYNENLSNVIYKEGTTDEDFSLFSRWKDDEERTGYDSPPMGGFSDSY